MTKIQKFRVVVPTLDFEIEAESDDAWNQAISTAKQYLWTMSHNIVENIELSPDPNDNECNLNGHRDTGRGVCSECGTFLPRFQQTAL